MAAPRVDNEYRGEIAKAQDKLDKLISNNRHTASGLLRLAYASQFSIANCRHADAGTNTSTDANTKKTQSANNDPKTSIGTSTSTDATPKITQSVINNLKTKIDSIQRDHRKITKPDLYQLAGVVALQKLGGPKIEFVPGRKESEIPPDEGCLPDVSVKGTSDLRNVFHQVGISNSNLIVALCGGLKMARRADPEKTLEFDNSYFKKLKQVDLHVEAFDIALLDDPEFHSRVVLYATDEDAFKRDYVVAHKKLSELGLPHSSFFISESFLGSVFENKTSHMPVTVTQRAVAAAVAAAVAIFSVFYLINRRRANKYSSQ